MNNSAFGMMQAANGMTNVASSKSAFGGEHDLAMLNKMDNKLSLDLVANKLTHKLAYLQEKFAKKHQDNNKTSFSALA